MAYGYGIDLRERVMAALDSGMSRKEACKIFKISLRTLCNWSRLRRETGRLECKKLPEERVYRKMSKEGITSYLASHPDAFLREISDHFGVTPQSVFAALKKFGITRKKNDSIRREK